MSILNNLNDSDNGVQCTSNDLLACISWHRLKASEINWKIKKYSMIAKKPENTLELIEEMRLHERFAKAIESALN